MQSQGMKEERKVEKVTLELLDPTGRAILKRKSLAPRLNTLEGKRIGLVWNNKPNGDILLAEIGELLKERYPGLKTMPHAVSQAVRELPPGELEGIAKDIDAAVWATAD